MRLAFNYCLKDLSLRIRLCLLLQLRYGCLRYLSICRIFPYLFLFHIGLHLFYSVPKFSLHVFLSLSLYLSVSVYLIQYHYDFLPNYLALGTISFSFILFLSFPFFLYLALSFFLVTSVCLLASVSVAWSVPLFLIISSSSVSSSYIFIIYHYLYIMHEYSLFSFLFILSFRFFFSAKRFLICATYTGPTMCHCYLF